MLTLNPTVVAAAERFTDGEITDAVLSDVAAMQGLPLHVERGAPSAPCAYEIASNTLRGAKARASRTRREYVAARARLSYANLRQPHLTAEARRRASRFARADAMRCLNCARIACLRAERAEAEAQAALAALSAPIELPLAA